MGKLGFVWTADKARKVNLAAIKEFEIAGHEATGYEVRALTFRYSHYILYRSRDRQRCVEFIDSITPIRGEADHV